MERNTVWNTLKQVLNNFFIAHVASKSIFLNVVYRHMAEVARSDLISTVASAR